MRRRGFIAFSFAVLGRAQAQEAVKQYRIALVSPANPLSFMTETGMPYYRALFDELRRLGFVEGENLKVERYSGGGRTERYPELVAEVVRSKPDLIFTQSTRFVRMFKDATTTIPIVAYVADPVANGFVSSLARPGGNITGMVSDPGLGIQGKYIELLRAALAGRLSRLGFLNFRVTWEQRSPSTIATKEAAERAGIYVVGGVLDSGEEQDYRRAFDALKKEHVDALLVNNDAENYSRHELIVRLAEEHALPALYPDRIFVESGGLMSYGFDLSRIYRRAANLIDKILKGANPAELPMEQPTSFQLMINLKTAKTLALEIPPTLLARADEVIE